MRRIKRGSNWDKLVKWYEEQGLQGWEEWCLMVVVITMVIMMIRLFLVG